MDIQKFIKTNNLELTLINEAGEHKYIGRAETVKPYQKKHLLRWKCDEGFDNVFPFTFAVLHGGTKILSTLAITPVRPDAKTIELVY